MTGTTMARVLAGVLLLTLGWSVACSDDGSAREPGDGPTPAAPDDVAVGRAIFATNCAECHGVAAQGHPDWRVQNADGTWNPPPLNGDGHAWHHSDGVLYRIVRDGGAAPGLPDGTGKMPAFGDTLSRQQIIDVLHYVKSHWHGKVFSEVSITSRQAEISVDDPFPATD